MSYGLTIADAAGRVVLSGASSGGNFAQKLVLSGSVGGTVTFDADARFSGRSARVLQVGAGSHDWAPGTSSGYPSITWSVKTIYSGNPAIDTELLVFIA